MPRLWLDCLKPVLQLLRLLQLVPLHVYYELCYAQAWRNLAGRMRPTPPSDFDLCVQLSSLSYLGNVFPLAGCRVGHINFPCTLFNKVWLWAYHWSSRCDLVSDDFYRRRLNWSQEPWGTVKTHELCSHSLVSLLGTGKQMQHLSWTLASPMCPPSGWWTESWQENYGVGRRRSNEKSTVDVSQTKRLLKKQKTGK